MVIQTLHVDFALDLPLLEFKLDLRHGGTPLVLRPWLSMSTDEEQDWCDERAGWTERERRELAAILSKSSRREVADVRGAEIALCRLRFRRQ